MATMRKIVKSTKNGQITIPIEFRRRLGNEGEGLWQVSLADHELTVSPLQTIDRTGDSDWYERLYDYFAPVREEILARGITEEEVNADIDAAIQAVRAARRQGEAPAHGITDEQVAGPAIERGETSAANPEARPSHHG